MCALAPSIFVAPSVETIAALCHFHPLVEVNLFPFVNNFHLKMNLVLDKTTFIYVLTCSPRLSFNDLLSMVYELLQDYFVFDDSISGFDILKKYASTSFVVMFFH